MAPTAPAPSKRLTARQKARARLADPLLSRKLHRENNVVTDSFINSKRDKRLIKSSAFASRIAKSSSSKSKSAASSQKRRRPSKKLVTTLESLGDALDDIRADMDEAVAEGEAMDAEQARQGKVRHKSLKSRPGALKRKERLVRGEMERFGRSLAQLATVSSAAAAGGASAAAPAAGEKMDTEAGEGKQRGETQTQTPAASSRWAALRGFISATMEQNPAFLAKT
ncbi:hypothetical protein N658DRAFT_499057 [Parathielavia hyrcaniae]|uniref:Ribosome biogenesis protein SLX9 n=1 Tax=Parathielavia hyrcaniae TaxID=113614 RepID=A0AAN6SYT1_9PEZI|nr:hypothetical protein N658DRAFT_499057 [Parathielavia hyrcaniae]